MPLIHEEAVETVARAICLTYGRDPDDRTSVFEMCDADDLPVPVWRVYEEQAEAAIAAYLGVSRS